MLEYKDIETIYEQVPGETCVSVNISNCPVHCSHCHSKHLWEPGGTRLSYEEVDRLIEYYQEATSFCFLGGDADPSSVNALAEHVRYFYPNKHIVWYSGRQELAKEIQVRNFDWIKLGPYDNMRGNMWFPTTNQRCYHVEEDGTLKDISEKYWERKELCDGQLDFGVKYPTMKWNGKEMVPRENRMLKNIKLRREKERN